MKTSSAKLGVAVAAVSAAVFVWLSGPGPTSDVAEFDVAEAFARRQLAQEQIDMDAANGHRTLWEAAALTSALDKLPPQVRYPVDAFDGPNPTAEWHCRRLIGRIESSADFPGQAAAVKRLQGELRAALDSPGGLRLPAPDAELVEALLNQVRDRVAQRRWGRQVGEPKPDAANTPPRPKGDRPMTFRRKCRTGPIACRTVEGGPGRRRCC